jgi:hypothetical protein
MFTVVDDGSLPSFAELVARDVGTSPSDATLGTLRRTLDDEDLPVTATMGFGDNLRALVERILFRKFVRDEADVACTLPWFECHVPPGGKTTMRTSATSVTERSCEIKVYGSGIGAGRKVSLVMTQASEPRAKCATYGIDCRVRPRVFDIRGRESVELEVVECLGESIVSHDICPYCGVAASDVDPFDFQFGQQLDLRNDDVTRKEKLQLTLDKSFSASAKLKIPALAPELTLGAKVSRSMNLEVEQEFPPHVLYRPYTRLGPAPLQTPMWAIERSTTPAATRARAVLE